ncbi:MAG: DUF4166 domain-containing protein [Hyphomicrobiaceae bacterium]|nr:DUF4166 domain-containing protein [Hyphomicrobiaceae bacterium]
MSPPPLYQRVLGSGFDRLPPCVRSLHDVSAPAQWSGRADVERGRSPLSRLLAKAFALPPDGRDQVLTVVFRPDGDGEVWERRFGPSRFVSYQSDAGGGRIHETVGAARLTLQPGLGGDGSLSLAQVGMQIASVPIPKLLRPQIVTREWDAEGRYRFEVEVCAPGLGPLVAYRGWLQPA